MNVDIACDFFFSSPSTVGSSPFYFTYATSFKGRTGHRKNATFCPLAFHIQNQAEYMCYRPVLKVLFIRDFHLFEPLHRS